MFGTFALFAAFYITLILSTLVTCSIFKENVSRVVIVTLAILSAIYVAGPAVEFMQGYIRACQIIADYIVVYCGPAGSVLLIMAVPALMFFIPAPPCKEEDQCCEDGCKSKANPSGYCDDCYVHPDRICPVCNDWGYECFENGSCLEEPEAEAGQWYVVYSHTDSSPVIFHWDCENLIMQDVYDICEDYLSIGEISSCAKCSEYQVAVIKELKLSKDETHTDFCYEDSYKLFGC